MACVDRQPPDGLGGVQQHPGSGGAAGGVQPQDRPCGHAAIKVVPRAWLADRSAVARGDARHRPLGPQVSMVNRATARADRDRHRCRGGGAGHHRQPLPVGGRGDPAGRGGGPCWRSQPSAGWSGSPTAGRSAPGWTATRSSTRFGAMLESSPGPDDLLDQARGRDLPGAAAAVGPGCGSMSRTPSSAAVRSTGTAGVEVGRPGCARPWWCRSCTAARCSARIECGPRRDGPLLDEDRRLLAHLASQAAAAVHNLHLSAQLGVTARGRSAGAGGRARSPRGPGSRRPRTPSGSGSSVTCTTGSSRTWSP